MPTALVTGASRGLGRALAGSLAADGWTVVIDGRDRIALETARREMGGRVTAASGGRVIAVVGDVTDPTHRSELSVAVEEAGRLDALVNNAGGLGPSPRPALADYPLEALEELYRHNVAAPLGLIQVLLPILRRSHGRIINVTSDAAVEAYEGWGGYGSSKAALEAITAVLAAEEPGLRVYAADPGDLRTDMHQAAFPGEDISDRPLPAAAVPGLRRLLEDDLPSGRYRVADLASAQAAK
ncbi:MAG TPA: SDR family oxidoreductase [Acidimicrobiales bacterium]|nr:SDR family oxidoreductase [Acidimicrobiales bacterium]